MREIDEDMFRKEQFGAKGSIRKSRLAPITELLKFSPQYKSGLPPFLLTDPAIPYAEDLPELVNP